MDRKRQFSVKNNPQQLDVGLRFETFVSQRKVGELGGESSVGEQHPLALLLVKSSPMTLPPLELLVHQDLESSPHFVERPVCRYEGYIIDESQRGCVLHICRLS